MPPPSHAQAYNPVTQEAQAKLAALGYEPGALDGVLTPQTRAALLAYQRRSGLRETGTFDNATLHKLGVGTSVHPAKSVRN